MVSAALTSWQTDRSSHLDELLIAHQLVGGPSRGRRWRTAALNSALILRLAAEFQGFARDLHDEGCDVFASWIAPGNQALENVVRNRLREGRELDRGNAHPGSIGNDFARFGFQLWPALAARDLQSAGHNAALQNLNKARNAFAHADEAKLASLRADGFPATLKTFTLWRRQVSGLAANLDVELAAQLGQLFGRPTPW